MRQLSEFTPAALLEVLNEFVTLDRDAAHSWVESRVPVSDAFMATPDAVSMIVVNTQNGQEVGVLGLLNGMLLRFGYRLAAAYDDTGKLESFDFVEKPEK